MRVSYTQTYDDQDRAFIARYLHHKYGEPMPKSGLATREQILHYIREAISNQDLGAADHLYIVEGQENADTDTESD